MFNKALITPRDVLAESAEEVTLEIELERSLIPFIDPPLAGVEVEVEGVGRRATDTGGRAAFPLGRLPVGVHRYRARVVNSGWRSGEAEALVQVAPREAPVFITDIDQTIADVSSFGYLFRGNDSVQATEHSREVLRDLAGRMVIVYLSARDHIFTAKTKAWLKSRDFPPGPLYVRRVRFWSISPREHKIRRLEEICSRFSNVCWGVGDLVGDVEAYAHRKIPPILLSRKRRDGLPPDCRCVATWKEIAEIVARAPR